MIYRVEVKFRERNFAISFKIKDFAVELSLVITGIGVCTKSELQIQRALLSIDYRLTKKKLPYYIQPKKFSFEIEA